jgi:hypothetical protein
MEQVFNERQRKVFPYFNGVAQVWGDPVSIYRRFLAACDGDINLILSRVDGDTCEKQPLLWAETMDRLMGVVREVLGMQPFDATTGKGATDRDCLDALQAWQAWMNEKKAPAAS